MAEHVLVLVDMSASTLECIAREVWRRVVGCDELVMSATNANDIKDERVKEARNLVGLARCNAGVTCVAHTSATQRLAANVHGDAKRRCAYEICVSAVRNIV
jgi:hypothetical protein